MFECARIGREFVGKILGEHRHDMFAFGGNGIVDRTWDSGFDDRIFGDAAVLGAIVSLFDIGPIGTNVDRAAVLRTRAITGEAGEVGNASNV